MSHSSPDTSVPTWYRFFCCCCCCCCCCCRCCRSYLPNGVGLDTGFCIDIDRRNRRERWSLPADALAVERPISATSVGSIRDLIRRSKTNSKWSPFAGKHSKTNQERSRWKKWPSEFEWRKANKRAINHVLSLDELFFWERKKSMISFILLIDPRVSESQSISLHPSTSTLTYPCTQ